MLSSVPNYPDSKEPLQVTYLPHFVDFEQLGSEFVVRHAVPWMV
jgi:hypothetical protein